MKMLFFLVPLIGAATGWLMISLAIQLLFRPVRPFRLPVVGVEIQGVLPKKRQELAAGIGELIKTQLELAVTGQTQTAEGFRVKMTDTIISSVREHLDNRIPFLIPTRVKNAIVGSIEDIIRREIPRFFEAFANNLGSTDGVGGHLERVAEQRINNFDLEELFKRVDQSGEVVCLKSAAAFLGFASGMLQLLLVWVAAA